MRCYIANTDYNWYHFLFSQASIEEVNFWRPRGGSGFRALRYGEPLIFKLKSEYDHAVVGFGLFVAHVKLAVNEAWQVFGQANGAATLDEMRSRIQHYVERFGGQVTPSHEIGCILLASPVFFPRELWVAGPRDWSGPIVAGKGYDTTRGEGKRIWEECVERAQSYSGPLSPHSSILTEPRYGRELIIRPRLGQGTFRFAVQDAYGRCAVTGERSLPALDASHIIPYSEGGTHEIPNGLLLRADIHRLFDRGYVTVTPDLRFRVSPRLMDEYRNGRQYYQLEDRRIITPTNPLDAPKREALEYHSEVVFQD